MRELPLVALRAFAAVWEHRGVRAAARELAISHSSVSRHIAELEKWLGVCLLDAAGGRRALAFTAQGEALGKAALANFRDLAQVTASLREARSTHSVTLSTTPSFAARWLLPRLAGFERAHPRIELSVLVDQRLDDLDARGIDLAIRMGRGGWKNVRSEPLMDDALYPVMSAAYWSEAGRPRTAADLAGLRLLHDRDPNAAWSIWREQHGPSSLDIRGGPRFASSDLVLRAAALGQGVALARHRLAADELVAGALLRPIPTLQVRLAHAYWLVFPERARTRAATATVADWLRRQVAAA